MSNINGLLNSIKSVLQNVSGSIGRVRIHPQRTITQESFESIFQIHLNEKRPVNAWVIKLDGISNSTIGATLNSYWRDYGITITGFMSFNDSSDNDLMNLAEDILNSFGPKKTLGITDVPATGEPVLFDSNTSLTEFDHGMLGPVLCSTVSFKVTAREWKGIISFV